MATPYARKEAGMRVLRLGARVQNFHSGPSFAVAAWNRELIRHLTYV